MKTYISKIQLAAQAGDAAATEHAFDPVRSEPLARSEKDLVAATGAERPAN